VDLQRDESAAFVEFLTQQHIVVMPGGDCGSGCVEPMVELLALASLFAECF
jgi:hypothetical protein